MLREIEKKGDKSMNRESKNTVNQSEPLKSYKKDFSYSYTLGAFPTIELIDARPDMIRKVLIHNDYTDREHIEQLCASKRIPVEYNNKVIQKVSDKENCFVVGVFDKYEDKLKKDLPHIVLVNPSNMGNLGTILRTAVGFGIYDLAVITPCADIFNPKTVRSSMGALFRLRHQSFSTFEEYEAAYPEHELFTFMLNKDKTLTLSECPKPKLYTLVFGNEATGLPSSFLDKGTSVMIPQSKDVDSLNLTIAVGIGAYAFSVGSVK